MSDEIIAREREQPQSGPLTIIQSAVERGAGVDVIERLVALQERVAADSARRAFHDALAAAKSELPATVWKSKVVDFTNKSGQRTRYSHAELGDVLEAVTPALSRHQLSLSWRTAPIDRGGIEVACCLAHAAGHVETSTLRALPDSSGGKNDIQAIGSAASYLQRYTAKSLIGIAEHGSDDDGAGTVSDGATDSQIARLESLRDDDRLPANARKTIAEILKKGCTKEKANKAIARAKQLIEESTGEKYAPPAEREREPGEEG